MAVKKHKVEMWKRGRLGQKQLELEEFMTEEKKTYSQLWNLYYASARTEKLMFMRIIKDAVDYLNIPTYYVGNGRPAAHLPDIIKALAIKVYCRTSSWRLESELKIAKQLGILDYAYKRTSINKYMSSDLLTYWLHKLYKMIAFPLAFIEDYVVIDGTGFGMSYGRKRWVEILDETRLHRDYKKLHIMSGARSNVIFSAEITKGTAHESPFLPKLLDQTTQYVSPKYLCADSGYLSKFNVDYVASKGLFPFIMPKKNSRTLNRGSQGAWGDMIWLWKEHKDLFKLHYHQRSNGEATFSALKRRFGFFTSAKTDTGQINEILLKIVCLNAVILAEAILEFNLEPKFMVT